MNRKFQKITGIFMVIFIVGALVLSLAACSNDPLAEQFRDGDSKNYIAGDGTVTEYAQNERPTPAPWGGPTESGAILESTDLAGVITVVNFWYAACAPCRAEAGDLAAISKEFEPDGVQFIGVNVRDTAETALAFDRNFGITYPSILDAQSGSVGLAFTGVVTPQAVPTTLVIDQDGRVASRILGRIEPSVLRTLISTVVSERDAR